MKELIKVKKAKTAFLSLITSIMASFILYGCGDGTTTSNIPPDKGTGDINIEYVWYTDKEADSVIIKFRTDTRIATNLFSIEFGEDTNYNHTLSPVPGEGEEAVLQHEITVPSTGTGLEPETNYYFKILLQSDTIGIVDYPDGITHNPDGGIILTFTTAEEVCVGDGCVTPCVGDDCPCEGDDCPCVDGDCPTYTPPALPWNMSDYVILLNTDQQGKYDRSAYFFKKEGYNYITYFFDSINPYYQNPFITPLVYDTTAFDVDTNNRTAIRGFTDNKEGAIVTLEDTTGFYTKYIYYNNDAIAFHATWALNAAADGLVFGVAPGYAKPWAQIVWNGLEVETTVDNLDNNTYAGIIEKIVTGTSADVPADAEMPGYSTEYDNLIYDEDLNFSTVSGLNAGDLILYADPITGLFTYGLTAPSNAFNTYTSAVTLSGYTTEFPYIMSEDENVTSLPGQYALLDSQATHSGVPEEVSGTTFRTSTSVDIPVGRLLVNRSTKRFSYITAVQEITIWHWGFVGIFLLYHSHTYNEYTLAHDIGLTTSTYYDAYNRIEGRIGTSGTARYTDSIKYIKDNYIQTYPLWDNDKNFSTAGIQFESDIVLNESNFLMTTVTSISAKVNKILRLTDDIMGETDYDSYWILRFNNGFTSSDVIAAGKRDSDSGSVNMLKETGLQYESGNIANAKTGDLVYNVNRNSYAVVIEDNITTLKLSRPIVNSASDTDTYIILPSDVTMLDTGICTSGSTGSTLVDSGADFITLALVPGDIVYNVTDNSYSTISVVNSATQLTLNSGSTTSGDKYYIVHAIPVASHAMFAWENGYDIIGALINLKNATTDQAFNICTVADTQQNVRLVTDSDNMGGAVAVYESVTDGLSTIYAKHLTVNGTTVSGQNPASLGEEIGPGTITDVLADGNGGLYILHKDEDTIYITWTDAEFTSPSFWQTSFTGTNAGMCIDTPGRVIITYLDNEGTIHVRRHSGAIEDYITTVGTVGTYFPNPADYVDLSIISNNANGALITWMKDAVSPSPFTVPYYLINITTVDSDGTAETVSVPAELNL